MTQLNLDLFIQAAIEEITEQEKRDEAIAAEARKFLFDGQETLTFLPDWTVYAFDNAWYSLIERAGEWETRYQLDIQALNEQLKQIGPRDRKARAPIKAKLGQLLTYSQFADALVHETWTDEQARFGEERTAAWQAALPADADDTALEDISDEFWMLVMERPYQEMTWHWTLAECAEVAFKQVTLDKTDEKQDSEWRALLEQIKTRATKRRDKRMRKSKS